MNIRHNYFLYKNVTNLIEMVEFDRFVASETYTLLLQSCRINLGGNLPLA